jgi:hypothetical protein
MSKLQEKSSSVKREHPDPNFIAIPDPGVEEAPDHGSATLFGTFTNPRKLHINH